MSTHLNRALDAVEILSPLGLVPAPETPTPEMIEAARRVTGFDEAALKLAYEAMLKAFKG